MTMYFPLVVHGAMLIEPTESESKESLDRFIHVLRTLALEAKARKTARFDGAPHLAPAPPPGRDRRRAQAGAALEAEGAAAGGGMSLDKLTLRQAQGEGLSQTGTLKHSLMLSLSKHEGISEPAA